MATWENRPRFAADFKHSTYAEAIAPTSPPQTAPDGSGTYTLDLKRDWCIGFVPHGGYLTSILLSATTTHITTSPQLAPLNQPHAIHISTTFFNASHPGPATLAISPAKTGRAYTFLRAVLAQGERRCLEAIVTFTNFDLQAGVTLPTLPPPQVPQREQCERLVMSGVPSADVRPVSKKLEYMLPRGKRNGSSSEMPSVREQWVRLADGGRMGLDAVGFLSDMYLPIPENYASTALTHWYPTLNLAIEFKRAPPPGAGWEWLFCRVECREIRNGRMDVDVDILDDEGRLVAVAKQLAIIVSNERNKPKGSAAAKL